MSAELAKDGVYSPNSSELPYWPQELSPALCHALTQNAAEWAQRIADDINERLASEYAKEWWRDIFRGGGE